MSPRKVSERAVQSPMGQGVARLVRRAMRPEMNRMEALLREQADRIRHLEAALRDAHTQLAARVDQLESGGRGGNGRAGRATPPTTSTTPSAPPKTADT